MRYSSIITIVLSSLVLLPTTVFAADSSINFDPSQNNTGLTSLTKLTFLSAGAKRDPATVTFSLINSALGLLGFVSMIIIIYGGVLWFRSGENEEQLTKAKGLITGAIIGLVLALGSLALSVFIFNVVLESTVAEQQPVE